VEEQCDVGAGRGGDGEVNKAWWDARLRWNCSHFGGGGLGGGGVFFFLSWAAASPPPPTPPAPSSTSLRVRPAVEKIDGDQRRSFSDMARPRRERGAGGGASEACPLGSSAGRRSRRPGC